MKPDLRKPHQFRVVGSWPFPTDMLRRDNARPATAADEAKIARLSGNVAPAAEADRIDVAIDLIIPQGLGYARPDCERWESFSWAVIGDEFHDTAKALKAEDARLQALYDAALAKLSPEDIEGIRWAARQGKLGCPPTH